jgi:hypothetical protein
VPLFLQVSSVAAVLIGQIGYCSQGLNPEIVHDVALHNSSSSSNDRNSTLSDAPSYTTATSTTDTLADRTQVKTGTYFSILG